eukprot:4164785-Prymnesium_polylepis.1
MDDNTKALALPEAIARPDIEAWSIGTGAHAVHRPVTRSPCRRPLRNVSIENELVTHQVVDECARMPAPPPFALDGTWSPIYLATLQVQGFVSFRLPPNDAIRKERILERIDASLHAAPLHKVQKADASGLQQPNRKKHRISTSSGELGGEAVREAA